ncbi:hypothetical protein [Facklamia sp. P12950]|uniref:hypothetical protein n=1 Tax=unclassified Facklamia TaxID=2622293 RepID=UPI003D17FBE0
MTTKERIYNALSTLGLPLAYADSDLSQLPRLNYILTYNPTIRKSNKRHSRRPIYQVDYFSNQAEDVESSEKLDQILNCLEEAGLMAQEFRESITPEEDENRTYYHYWTVVQ